MYRILNYTVKIITQEAQTQFKTGQELSRLESRFKDFQVKTSECPIDASILLLKDSHILLQFLKEQKTIASFMHSDARFQQSFHEKLSGLVHLFKESRRFTKFLIETQEQMLLLLEIDSPHLNPMLQKLLNEHQKHLKRLASVL